MAIKNKRARYKKGKRVDMRGGGRVRLAKGSSAATKRKKKAAQAKKAAPIQQPSRSAIRGRPTEEQSQVIRPAGIQEAPRPIGGKGAGKGQVTESFDPNLGRPKPQSGILQNQLSPLSQQGITSPATPEERQRFEERQLRMQAAATGPRGGPLVPPTPEEIARRKAIQAQPIPEGFVRNLATGELEPMRPPVPGEFDTLQGQPIPQEQIFGELETLRGRPDELAEPGDQPVRGFPAPTPEQLAEQRRTAGLPQMQLMQQAQRAAPAAAPKTQAELLASMQGMAGATARKAAPAATAAEAEAAAATAATAAMRTIDDHNIEYGDPIPDDDPDFPWNEDWNNWLIPVNMEGFGFPEDTEDNNYTELFKYWMQLAQSPPPAGWGFDPENPDKSYKIRTHPKTGEIVSLMWLKDGEQYTEPGLGGGPFPDPSKIAYGQPTYEQQVEARYQVEQAAKGELPEGAEVPTPAQLKTDDPRFTGEGNFDFSVDWQEGGNIGKYSKTDAGQTGEELFKALYAAGSDGTPADSIVVAGKTYTWDDFHNLIAQDTGLHGTQKPAGIYEADVTQIGDELGVATAGGVGTAPVETVTTQTTATAAQEQTPEDITKAGVERVTGLTPTTGIAVGAEPTEATAIRIDELTAEAVAAGMPEEEAIAKAKADIVVGTLSAGAQADKQVGVGGQFTSPTPQAEAQSREGITGTRAEGDAAQINGIPTFEAATRQTVTGTARTGGAADMVAEVANIPSDIAAAISEDAATVTAQIDNESVAVQAAIAALPTEALVSSQMETLLAGLEEGTTPVWARPAVAQVQDMMAQRGLDVSTVARDALFNAIIQSAMPIAQQNAQALQQRAAMNLSNQQQANLAQATQDMQRRMANVANSQTASSQTAQMAQQIAVQQGTFGQQAVMTTAEQQQQQRLLNLQNQQEASRITAQQEQQANLANLSNEQQMEVTNLQIEAERVRGEMDAEQQGKLAVFQTAADYMAKNAAFTQQMELANLSADDKLNLANLSAVNQAAAETMSSEDRVELANLQAKMQVGITNANLANAMGIAQLSSDQAIAMTNAQIVAGMDMANFSVEQQTTLANSKFMQTLTLQDFSQEQQAAMQNATSMAQLDLAAVDQRTKLSITNANNFLQMDMKNMDTAQQAYIVDAQMKQQGLLSDQAAFNASEQFNAASQNQLDQYMTGLAQQIEITNVQRNDSMQQFNATQKNAAAARKAGNEQQARLLSAQLKTDVSKFNDQQEYNREQFNATAANQIEQFNVNWRRDANKIDTAAINAVNQKNAEMAFQSSTQGMAFMWQELRDNMDYSFKTYDNDQQRKASLIVAALGNEAAVGDDGKWANNYSGFSKLIDGFLNDSS